MTGRVALNDLFDCCKENPTGGFACGQIVRCYVLEVGAGGHLDLSLRASRGGCEGQLDAPLPAKGKKKDSSKWNEMPTR